MNGESLELKVLVGLGNPGEQYQNSRHNIGFAVIDELARKHRARFTLKRCRSLVARTDIGGCSVVLAKPLTFVNLSGAAVACLMRWMEVEPADVLVILDDVNLPYGKVRIRPRGSDGGHKGLRSIIEHIVSEEFPRLRVGVGSEPLPDDLTDFVLGTFTEDEMDEMPTVVETCCRAAEIFVVKGTDCAMNEFN